MTKTKDDPNATEEQKQEAAKWLDTMKNTLSINQDNDVKKWVDVIKTRIKKR